MTATPPPSSARPAALRPRTRRRRGRALGILLVVLGVVLPLVATTTPASAETEWYQVGQLNGGDGPARDSFIINDASVTITAKYLVSGTTVKGVLCRYTFNSQTRALYSDGNWANTAVKNAVDGQKTGVTNRLLAMNIRDSDGTEGGRAGFTGRLEQEHPGATSLSVCRDPNVITTASSPSKRRIAAGSILGGAVGVTVYGAAAAATVAVGAGSWLGTPAWEAAAGCLAGVVGRIVYDRIVNGKVGTAAYYVGICALGAAGAAGMTRLAGYFGKRPSFLADSVLSMGRYALGYYPAIETEGDIEMVLRHLNNG